MDDLTSLVWCDKCQRALEKQKIIGLHQLVNRQGKIGSRSLSEDVQKLQCGYCGAGGLGYGDLEEVANVPKLSLLIVLLAIGFWGKVIDNQLMQVMGFGIPIANVAYGFFLKNNLRWISTRWVLVPEPDWYARKMEMFTSSFGFAFLHTNGGSLITMVVIGTMAIIGAFKKEPPPISSTAQQASSNSWKSEFRSPLPIARTNGAAAVVKERIYFVGGVLPTATSGAVHEFDPARNSWASRAAMPAPKGAAAAVEMGGSIYILGGRRDNQVLATVEKYNPESNAWSKTVPMPTARWNLMAAVADGKIYAIGGIAGVGNSRRVLDIVEVYDPVAESWASASALPVGNSNGSAVSVGRKIYVVGGRLRAGNAEGSATSKVFVYDLATRKWAAGPSLNQDRSGADTCVVKSSIVAIGGAKAGNLINSVEVLMPGQDKWRVFQNVLRKARTDHSSAVVGEKIYVIGGVSSFSVQGFESSVEELSLAAQ